MWQLVRSPHEAGSPAWISSDGSRLRNHVVLVVPDLLPPGLHVEAGLVLALPELVRGDVPLRAAVAGAVVVANTPERPWRTDVEKGFV